MGKIDQKTRTPGLPSRVLAGALLISLFAAAGCADDDSDPVATCEEYAVRLDECEDVDDVTDLVHSCQENVAEEFSNQICALECDPEDDCETYNCCISTCFGSLC
jgi:hypothetical protein